MKLSFLLLTLFSFSCLANISAQEVSLQVKNETFRNVLIKLSKQSGYTFIYNNSDVSKAKRLNLDLQKIPFETAIEIIFEDQPLTYVMDGKVLSISPKPEEDNLITSNVQEVWTARVVDSLGKPLAGANISVRNKNIRTNTNHEGYFTLSGVQASDFVQFTFLGYKPLEISFRDKKDVIVLYAQSAVLEGVVVTGYNTINKQSFTGTAVQITKEELSRISNLNLIGALQVFDPSLRMMDNKQTGSNPNALPEFYVRGQSGFPGVMELDQIEGAPVSQFALKNNPNLPVFMVDGFEASLEKIYDLNINRIEQITILKDAAATAMYGSRASNGVIVIQTVQPKPGQIRATYQMNLDVTAPDLSSYNLMNASQKLEAERLAGLFQHHPNKPRDQYYESGLANFQWLETQKQNMINKGIDTYWLGQPLSTMFNNRHNLYIEGGSEAIRLGVEMRYDIQNGVMKESGRDRIGAGVSLEYRYKGLQIRNQTFLDMVNSKDSPYGNFSDFSRLQPYDAIYDENGGYNKIFPFYQGLSNVVNPIYEASLKGYSEKKYQEFTDNLSANWFLNNYLTLRGQFAVSYKQSNSEKFVDPNSARFPSGIGIANEDKGQLGLQKDEDLSWNANLFGTFNRSINEHSFNIASGFNAKYQNYDFESSLYRGFPSGSLSSVAYAHRQEGRTNYSDNKTRLFGAFANLNYTFQNIYLFDASFRLDGSSEFGNTNRWAPFWSLGAGLNLHNYLESNSLINILRVRANVGQTGKSNFAPYMANHTYKIITDGWYPTGIAAELKYMGNEALTWEKQVSTNIGADISIKNRFTLEANYYNKMTYDLISDVTIPSSTGFTVYRDNVGKVLNRGFELLGNFKVLSSRNWDVVLFGNLAHNKNKIVEIAESMKQYNDRVDGHYEQFKNITRTQYEWLDDNSAFNMNLVKPVRKFEEGSSLTAIYGMRSLGINPADGEEVFMTRDGQITKNWSTFEQDVIGNTEPLFQGAWGINLRYKQFSMYTSFLYSVGGDVYNESIAKNIENLNLLYYNGDVRVLTDRWQKPGDIAPLKSIQDRYFVTRPTSRLVQKENYLAFNSVSLMYDIKPELIQKYRVQSLRLGLLMNDLGRFSTIRQERGLDYPFARTFSFNLNLTF